MFSFQGTGRLIDLYNFQWIPTKTTHSSDKCLLADARKSVLACTCFVFFCVYVRVCVASLLKIMCISSVLSVSAYLKDTVLHYTFWTYYIHRNFFFLLVHKLYNKEHWWMLYLSYLVLSISKFKSFSFLLDHVLFECTVKI